MSRLESHIFVLGSMPSMSKKGCLRASARVTRLEGSYSSMLSMRSNRRWWSSASEVRYRCQEEGESEAQGGYTPFWDVPQAQGCLFTPSLSLQPSSALLYPKLTDFHAPSLPRALPELFMLSLSSTLNSGCCSFLLLGQPRIPSTTLLLAQTCPEGESEEGPSCLTRSGLQFSRT